MLARKEKVTRGCQFREATYPTFIMFLPIKVSLFSDELGSIFTTGGMIYLRHYAINEGRSCLPIKSAQTINQVAYCK